MIYKKILTLPFVLMLSLAFLFSSCGTESDTGVGSMVVEMTDAPIDSADAVNVFIEQVEVQNQDEEGDGWVVLNEPQQSYDLLELTNGATEVIGRGQLEAGTYSQIRLILSEGGHSVTIDGQDYDMKVPSGPQTGVKLNVNAEIEPDVEYVLLLDFDASRSVVKAGRDNPSVKYILKPVIQAKEKAVTGSIAGIIEPVEAKPVVYALSGSDTLSTTIADTANGEFKLIGLEEGSYDVSVEPREDGYQSLVEESVDVEVEQTNDIGTIELSQQ